MAGDGPMRKVIDANASDEEVAAIIAALTVLMPSGQAAPESDADASHWVEAARLAARRSGMTRGDWRLSGRIGRRSVG
ncbi:MAG: hypothetical protein JJE46_05180 [Acidimicrobiia bacterium]|nr:hypothetical protein [Acidimicrobiia bacterium]